MRDSSPGPSQYEPSSQAMTCPPSLSRSVALSPRKRLAPLNSGVDSHRKRARHSSNMPTTSSNTLNTTLDELLSPIPVGLPLRPTATPRTRAPTFNTRLNAQTTSAGLKKASEDFDSLLRQLQFQEKKKGFALPRLTESEVNDLVSFFFHDLFGDPCQQHIFNILDHGAAVLGGPLFPEAAPRPASLSSKVEGFLRSYPRWNSHSAIQCYDLYLIWQTLRDHTTEDERQTLRTFLVSRGLKESRGCDIRTCLLDYLAQELQISRSSLNNHLQNQTAVDHLVREFGLGILVLLPKVATGK